MTFKYIVLNLDQESAVEPLVSVCRAIGDSSTHLVGVYTLPLFNPPVIAVPYMPVEVYQELDASSKKQADRIGALFEESAQRDNLPIEWYVHQGMTASGTSAVVEHALTADLVVTSLASSDKAPWVHRELLGRSSTPLLVVPESLAEVPAFRKIAVAWDGTSQAARSIRDAMPLLRQAENVTVVCTRGQSRARPDIIAGSDVATWLTHHGIPVFLDEHREKQLTLGIAFVDYTRQMSADLIVMGGYGHSPLYDSLIGGWTDDVLENSTCPVFLSH
ncbi:MAG: universal stress protein [Granulosicoccus sp.]|nr:universal stress protein [Granulosicoccus sp.]